MTVPHLPRREGGLVSDYEYELPASQIAQYPLEKRDESRLLVVNRHQGELGHLHFRDLPRLFDP